MNGTSNRRPGPDPHPSPSDRAGAPLVVVGVDGSPASVAALRHAAGLADRLGYRIEAVGAWHYQTGFGTFLPVDLRAEETARLALERALAEAFPRGVPAWVSSRTVQGKPAEVLLEASRGAELLVVARHGKGHLAESLIGSVARHAATHSDCPVLVLPGG